MKVSKEFKVGLFMIVAITLLYFGFNFLKGIDFFTTNNRYYAFYENVDGLTESNQVLLNGYAVGRVRHVEIQQDKNRVLVELDIDSDIVVTKSTVALLNGELLGGRFIQLMMGKGGEPLQAKDTLRAEVAKGLMDFLTENAEPVAANLQTTLKKVNVILDHLTTNSQRLDTLFMDLRKTPVLLNHTIVSANTNFNELASGYKAVAHNLNGSLHDLKPTLANLKTVSDSLKMIQLNGTLTKAQQSLTRLSETLARLNKGDNTMSKLMTEDTLYVNLNKLLISIDSLAKHFNDNPKDFMAPLGRSKKRIDRDRRKAEEKKKSQQ